MKPLTKIKEFVKGYLFNKVQKRNLLLARGFVEGCYNSKDDYEYINGSKVKDNNIKREGIEKKIEEEQTEQIINFAGMLC